MSISSIGLAKLVAVVGAASVGGMGVYNAMTTGCPLGSCSKDASAAYVAASATTGSSCALSCGSGVEMVAASAAAEPACASACSAGTAEIVQAAGTAEAPACASACSAAAAEVMQVAGTAATECTKSCAATDGCDPAACAAEGCASECQQKTAEPAQQAEQVVEATETVASNG